MLALVVVIETVRPGAHASNPAVYDGSDEGVLVDNDGIPEDDTEEVPEEEQQEG